MSSIRRVRQWLGDDPHTLRGRQLDALLAEFTALRNEIDTACRNVSGIAWQGAIALGAIYAGAGAVLGTNEAVSAVIFGAAAPVILLYFLVLWVEEVVRIIRAGEYIRDHIEPKVRKLVGTNAVHWQAYLSSHEHWTRYDLYAKTQYRGTPIVILLVAALSFGLSSQLIVAYGWGLWWLSAPISGGVAFFGAWLRVTIPMYRWMDTHYRPHVPVDAHSVPPGKGAKSLP